MIKSLIGSPRAFAIAATCAGLSLAITVQAHVVVQPKTALPGSRQTLHFVVGHGCSGQPTTGLRVEFPADVEQIQPQPKAGWSVETRKSATGVVTLIWSGSSFAPHQANGFEVTARLPSRTGVLAFPAFQSCGATEVDWTQRVAPDMPKPAHPVPMITLSP